MTKKRTTKKRAAKKRASTKVEATVHSDTRTNIPTADAHDFLSPEDERTQSLRYPRDVSLDPQIVWKGKDIQDDADLDVDAPPIFIQEKIDPRVLIENLRHTKTDETSPELTLFDSFDGLGGLDIVEFYQHEANWSNRMILGDSLQVMGSLAEREHLRGHAQMVFIDPPYGIKFGSNWQVSTRTREVKDGKLDDVSVEVEQIKAFRDTWELGIHSYLAYLRDRLVVARDLLTESGSCFVQIGDDNVHRVRMVMDEVFGADNFVSHITFQKTTSSTSAVLAAVADHLLWYGRNRSTLKYRELNPTRLDSSAYNRIEEPDGTRRSATKQERVGHLKEGDRRYFLSNLTSQSGGPTTRYPVEFEGRTFTPQGSSGWKTNQDGMERLRVANRLEARSSRLEYVRYLDESSVTRYHNVWTDTVSGFMDKTYVVQTNSKVIERCMLMCTDPGDLVIDPTCGAGTTAHAAERWGRRWITIDTSRVALALARGRIMGARHPFYVLADSPAGRRREAELTGRAGPSTPPTNNIRHGFVYKRIPHITLNSIAQNPDIHDGMTRDDIDAAIARYADFKVLYDQPYEDTSKVRVAGPFTVESLSPHRSLAFGGDDPSRSELEATRDPSAASFEAMIVDNLTRAGIQNGRRGERLTIASIDSYAGRYIHAVADTLAKPTTDTTTTDTTTTDTTSTDTSIDIDETTTGVGDVRGARRVGITIGPQYSTVGSQMIKDATREALQATPELDMLAVLAFSFDPHILGVGDGYTASADGFADVAGERHLGRMPILLVRMNNDLVMGDSLAATGSGNLFTVFGEPDIDYTVDGDEVTVKIRGVDVYDPSTGEIRSRNADNIALWMIDTNYNDESFFVRHCYFTGGKDPYKQLKKALKADIDPAGWDGLRRTESRPFPLPASNRIAVKVINDYGDEVVKVITINTAPASS